MSANVSEITSAIREDLKTSIAVATLVVLCLVLAFVLIVPASDDVISDIETFLLFDVGPLYAIALLLCSIMVGVIALGPWGSLVLGEQDAEPDYDNITYFSMIMSIGIAAGIAFFGPGEAIVYLDQIPPGISPDVDPRAKAAWGMGFTLIHWGVITSVTTVVMALPIAYYCYRRGAPFRVSSALHPVVRNRPVAAGAIDVFAVVALIFGLSSSTMEVTQNFLAGIEFQWSVANPTAGVIIFGIAIATVYTMSAITGINRGIRRISLMSLAIFCVLTIATLIVGPTGSIGRLSLAATVSQPAQIAAIATNLSSDWVAFWSLFNWAIWFSIAAGYGLFTARISRGRTIREIIGYAVVGSGVANMIWFYVIGGAVLQTHLSGQADIVSIVTSDGLRPEIAGYPMFLSLPLGELFLFLFLGIGLLFIINSADSQTLSAAMITSQQTASPPWTTRLLWGAVIAITAIVLIVGGGEDAVGSFASITGAIIAVLSVLSLGVLLVSLWRNGGREGTEG